MRGADGVRPKRRIIARPAGAHGDLIPHCGTYLAGGDYLVHFNAEIIAGTKPILGREIEVELSPDDARDLGKLLVAAADRAVAYQQSKDSDV